MNPYLLFDHYDVDQAARVVWDGRHCFELGVIKSAILSAIRADSLYGLPVGSVSPFEEDYIIDREDLFDWYKKKGLVPFHPTIISDNIEKNEQNTALKKLDPRKENTLHILLATLAKKLNYSPDNKDTVGKIKAFVELEGLKMDEKTIRTNMKEAFNTLKDQQE